MSVVFFSFRVEGIAQLEQIRALSTSTNNLRSGLSLRANFTWTFVGNVVYAGCQWGMLVVLAKLAGPEMVGRFALALAITAPIFMFASLRLRTVQATDAKREYLFGDYLGLRLTTTAMALLGVAGIVLVTGFPRETELVILAMGAAKAIEAISDTYYGLLMQYERMDRIAKSMVIKGPLSLVGLAIGVYLTGSVFWGVVGLAVARALILLSYDVRSVRSLQKAVPEPASTSLDQNGQEGVLGPRWKTAVLSKLAWMALPLGIVTLLIALIANIPVYFIAEYWGETELGIFAAVAYLRRAGHTVVTALGRSTTPRLAKYYATRDGRSFKRLLLKLVGISALLGVAGVLTALVAGKPILALLYGADYARPDLFAWLMVAAGVEYIAMSIQPAMTSARRFRVQIPLYVIVTVTVALVCLMSIPSRGLLGAAAALIIASVVRVGLSLVVIRRALRELERSAEPSVPTSLRRSAP